MFALTRLPPLLRMLAFALLMAGVLVKPVLAFAGELHEAEHAALSGEDLHAHAGSDQAPDPVDPPDGKNPWHALMHFGHCCGQAPALMPLAYIGPHLPTADVPLPPWSAAFKPAAQPVALRPPITT